MSNAVANQQEQDFEAYLRDTVKKIIAEGDEPKEPNQQTQTAKDAPIVIDWGGQKYQFESQEQLNQTLKDTFSNVQSTITTLQQQIQEKGGQQATEKPVLPKFDTNKYAKLMGEDPIAASEYLDSHRYFNGQVEKPSEIIRNAVQKNQELEALLSAYQFKDNHRDYVPSPQNSQILGAIREQYGLPANLQGLEAAYAIAVQNKYIQPQVQQQTNGTNPQWQQAAASQGQDSNVEFNYQGYNQSQQQPAFQQQRFPGQAPPPPFVNQSQQAAAGNDLNVNDLEQLSIPQIEKIINQLQNQR